MSADIAIYTQAGLDLGTLLSTWDPQDHSQWRIFSKLGECLLNLWLVFVLIKGMQESSEVLTCLVIIYLIISYLYLHSLPPTKLTNKLALSCVIRRGVVDGQTERRDRVERLLLPAKVSSGRVLLLLYNVGF
jgi:hypothetical protein